MTERDGGITYGLMTLSATGGPVGALLRDAFSWEQLLPTFRNGAVVWQTRVELRLSQTELAKAAGISQQLLAMIEAGQRRMSERVMQLIWRALWKLHQAQTTPPAVELLIRLDEAMNAMVVTQSEKVAL